MVLSKKTGWDQHESNKFVECVWLRILSQSTVPTLVNHELIDFITLNLLKAMLSKIRTCGNKNEDGSCESEVYDPDTNQKETFPIDVKTGKIHLCNFKKGRFKKETEMIREDENNWELWSPESEEYLLIEFENWKGEYIKARGWGPEAVEKWHVVVPEAKLRGLGKKLKRSAHAIEEQLKIMKLIPGKGYD